MTEINLDDYKLNQEVLDLPDHVLELWYGKAGLFFINQLRRVVRLTLSKSESKVISYNINNNDFDWIIFCDDAKTKFVVDEYRVLYIMRNNYGINSDEKLFILIKNILEQVVPNSKIKSIW